MEGQAVDYAGYVPQNNHVRNYHLRHVAVLADGHPNVSMPGPTGRILAR
jgi:hypothetical protein